MMGFSTYQPSRIQHKANSVSTVPNTVPPASPLSSEISRIEAALLSLSSIQDCIVLEQPIESHQIQRTAYVVASESLVPKQLHLQLQAILPTTPLPTNYISLGALPLTEQGQVDQQALSSIETTTEGLQQTNQPLQPELPDSQARIHSCSQPLAQDTSSNLSQNRLPSYSPEPLYQKSWKNKPALIQKGFSSTGQTLILSNQSQLGSQLCDQLDQLNQPYVQVEPGSDFAGLTPNYYYLNPVNPYHYQQLLESIITTDLPVTEIVHLWTYHRSFRRIAKEKALEYSLDLGVHSLWFLAQALKAIQGEAIPVRLLVTTNHKQVVQPWSRMGCDRTPEIRLLQTLSQGQPGLHCCHLDLPELESIENVNRILQELSTVPSDLEVTYYQGQRWVAMVEPMTLNLA